MFDIILILGFFTEEPSRLHLINEFKILIYLIKPLIVQYLHCNTIKKNVAMYITTLLFTLGDSMSKNFIKYLNLKKSNYLAVIYAHTFWIPLWVTVTVWWRHLLYHHWKQWPCILWRSFIVKTCVNLEIDKNSDNNY